MDEPGISAQHGGPSHGDVAGVGDAPASRTFDDVWEVASGYAGWLTPDQARSLWNAGANLSSGAMIVEIGSHQGRSTAVLAGAAENRAGHVAAIDPFDDPRWGGGQESRNVFLKNLALLDLTKSVIVVQGFSTTERSRWNGPIDLLYIDGAHDFRTVCDDLKWANFLKPGGLVAVHDGFSSVGVTAGLLRGVLLGNKLRYVRRIGSLVWFVNEPPTALARLHLAFQTPWFIRNMMVKTALRHDWTRVVRLLRHTGGEYPY